MIKLRKYQEETIASLRAQMVAGNKRLIMCAPTGAGKTVMFSYMAKAALAKGKRILIITDRIEILMQSGGTLKKFGINPVIIDPNYKEDTFLENIYIGMAQTLSRRISKVEYQTFFKSLDLIILDEAHKQTFNGLQQHMGDHTIVIGATATPLRIKNQISLHKFYDKIVEEVTLGSLIKDGYLAVPKYFSTKVDLSKVGQSKGDFDTKELGDMYSEQQVYEGVIENYLDHSPGEKALIFASSVVSSEEIINEFCSKGIEAKHIDALTPKDERVAILKWFSETPGAIISNVGILTAGYDCPSVQVIILYRATMSLTLFLQMIGRGSRITETKKKFKILDFGNNIERHGLWHGERAWSLVKKERKKGVPVFKECPKCGFMCPIFAKECGDPECDHIFKPSEKEIEEKEQVRLAELSHPDILKMLEKQLTIKELTLIQQAKGYHKRWVWWQTPDGKKESARREKLADEANLKYMKTQKKLSDFDVIWRK